MGVIIQNQVAPFYGSRCVRRVRNKQPTVFREQLYKFKRILLFLSHITPMVRFTEKM